MVRNAEGRNGATQRLGDPYGRGLSGARQDNSELLASMSGDKVAGALRGSSQCCLMVRARFLGRLVGGMDPQGSTEVSW